MDYGYVMSQGWSLVWRNRFIWILGFLIALGGGGIGLSGQFNLNFSPPTPASSTQEFDSVTSGELERAIGAVESGDVAPLLEVLPLVLGISLAVLVFFIIAVVIISLLLWLLSLVARSGLIAAVDQSNQGLQPTFGSAMRVGTRSLLPVVGMKIILALPFMLIGILAFVAISGSILATYQSLMSEDPSPLAILGVFPFVLGLFCLAIPLSVFFQIIDASAYRGIVIQNMGVFRAIRHGFDLFFRHLIEILVLGVIFVGVGILVSFGLIAAFFPIQFFWSFLFFAVEGGVWVYIAAFGWFLLSTAVIALVSALLVAWQSTTFSVAYLQFVGRNQPYGSYAPPAGSPTILKTP